MVQNRRARVSCCQGNAKQTLIFYLTLELTVGPHPDLYQITSIEASDLLENEMETRTRDWRRHVQTHTHDNWQLGINTTRGAIIWFSWRLIYIEIAGRNVHFAPPPPYIIPPTLRYVLTVIPYKGEGKPISSGGYLSCNVLS